MSVKQKVFDRQSLNSDFIYLVDKGIFIIQDQRAWEILEFRVVFIHPLNLTMFELVILMLALNIKTLYYNKL